MKGRKPKPTALQVLHGDPSHLRGPQMDARKAFEGPPPAPDALDPPEELSGPQRELWMDAIKYAPPGVLRRIDAMALRVWVIASDIYRQACYEQSQTKLLVRASPKDENSMPVQSPYLAIINRQAVLLLRAAEQLGFTPVSRPRLFSAAGPVPDAPRVGTAAPPGSSLEDYIAGAPARPALN